MASLTAFLITAAFLWVYWRYRYESLSVFVFPLVFLLTLVAALGGPIEPWVRDSVGGVWAALHVVLFLVGYAALFLTCASGVMYLIQEHELKSKQPARVLLSVAAVEQTRPGRSSDTGFRLCRRHLGV